MGSHLAGKPGSALDSPESSTLDRAPSDVTLAAAPASAAATPKVANPVAHMKQVGRLRVA